ncbi:hypothetical protein IP510_12265 [Psychrobacter sp. NG254]|uniref:virulence factor TspB C-terminal domain-related protein n=2 Tax=Gammaproteobacteria TaxID=1236 RepID=UPI001887792D|nr:virulence factor TspB C-terminal domain-related protein [Psychrobacter sp. NG254]MBF2720646.1 hypothetical protein [Psychrobacter sp. NG254]MBF2720655.1 hypothetical protein [Psychrobacter sp. NG254]
MHINLLYRKVLYVFLSLLIVFANTQTAFAASSWSVTSAVSAGSRTVVSASKAGYKSAVNIAPTAGRLALKLGKGANWAALVYAAIQLAPDLADIDSFRPEYAQDRVAYDLKPQIKRAYVTSAGKSYVSMEDSCKYYISIKYPRATYNKVSQTSSNSFSCYFVLDGSIIPTNGQILDEQIPAKTEYISIPAAAAQVIKNADSGHASSKSATLETATEMVIGGQFDADLLSGAVPTSDNKPLVPSVPISGNGNVTHGSDIGVGDSGMSGASPGDQADAAKDAADAAKKAGQAAVDAAKDAANAASDAADAAADLVNSGADTAAIDAANAKAAAAEKAAADAKAVSDAAVAAANDRAAAAERAADAATQAAQAAADKAAADVAAAKASGDTAAQAAAEAAKEAADAAVAAAKEKQAAAEKAAEKAKAEATKPFELPAFCSWATPVCDYMTWVKQEYSGMKEWLTLEAVESVDDNVSITETIEDGWQDKVNAGYVSFQSQCPDNVLIPVSLMGASQNLNISYAPFCHFASLINPAVILGAWISGLLIISGGRGRE